MFNSTARLLTIAIAGLISVGCAASMPGRTYEGKYFYHFEASTFTPKGSEERWCVSSTDMERARLPAHEAPSPFGGAWGSADVIVRGELSPKGNYCSLGASPYLLKVHEIIKVENMKAGDP